MEKDINTANICQYYGSKLTYIQPLNAINVAGPSWFHQQPHQGKGVTALRSMPCAVSAMVKWHIHHCHHHGRDPTGEAKSWRKMKRYEKH